MNAECIDEPPDYPHSATRRDSMNMKGKSALLDEILAESSEAIRQTLRGRR